MHCFVFLLFILAASNLPGKEKVDLILSGGTIVTMDPARSVVDDGAIAVRGEQILDIGTSGEIRNRYRASRVISARGMIILPGLINTHNHAPMTLFRGIA